MYVFGTVWGYTGGEAGQYHSQSWQSSASSLPKESDICAATMMSKAKVIFMILHALVRWKYDVKVIEKGPTTWGMCWSKNSTVALSQSV